VIFVSGIADKTDPFVTNCGAAAYLEKPVSMAELREALDAVQQESEAA